MSSFSLTMTSWHIREHGEPDERATFGEFVVAASGEVLTELVDAEARTTRNGPRVSGSVVAHWFAWNWWRLVHDVSDEPTLDWRMSHSLAAAGGGFLWPNMEFSSDGESVRIRQRIEPRPSGSNLRYLVERELVVDRASFEGAVWRFLDSMVERIAAIAPASDRLAELVSTLREEIADPEVRAIRKLEALLRRDPDELEPAMLDHVRRRVDWMGAGAADEWVAAYGPETTADAADALRAAARSSRTAPLDESMMRRAAAAIRLGRPAGRPWEEGRSLASLVRQAWGFALEPIPLESVLGTSLPAKAAARPTHWSAGVLTSSGQLRPVYRTQRASSARFDLARIVGDALLYSESDACFPATDVTSARQKRQRAFAQELLCPIEGLLQRVTAPHPTEAEMEEAAQHFGVSEWTVRSALVNHGVIARDYLP